MGIIAFSNALLIIRGTWFFYIYKLNWIMDMIERWKIIKGTIYGGIILTQSSKIL